jgi:hypothetical protein
VAVAAASSVEAAVVIKEVAWTHLMIHKMAVAAAVAALVIQHE